jgi:hypothetical protein
LRGQDAEGVATLLEHGSDVQRLAHDLHPRCR